MNSEVTKKVMRDGSVLLFCKGSMCQMHDMGRGLVLHVCRGITRGEFAPYVIEHGEHTLRRDGRCIYMVDLFETTALESSFREQMTAFFKAHPEVTAHMLVKSKLLEMAANLANVFTGRRAASFYSKVDEWLWAGKRENSLFRRRPIDPGYLKDDVS